MTDKTLPQYEHDGRSLTVPEWAAITGIRSYDISMRLRQGWTLARIIENVKPTSTPAEPQPASEIATSRSWATRIYTYNGETLSAPEWAARAGISLKCLKGRLLSGWGLQRALSTPLGKRPMDEGTAVRTLTFNGDTLTLKQWAKRAGITRATLMWRLERWPVERALNQASREDLAIKRRQNGQTATLKEAAARAGIAYSTVVTRLRSGWTLNQALSISPGTFMGNNSHRANGAPLGTASTQPQGAMSPSQGGRCETFDPHRGPAGDGSREIAPKQGFF